MIIKVENLKTDVDKLKNLVNEYENNVLNLYNTLTYTSNSWSDGNSIRFYDDVKTEKLNNLTFVSELKDVLELYKKIVDKYRYFGNIINCNVKDKYSVLNSIDRYLNTLKDIIKSYNALDLSFCPSESNILNRQLMTLNADYNRLKQTRVKIGKYFDKIDSIEQEVNLLTTKINISYIKENEYKNYL